MNRYKLHKAGVDANGGIARLNGSREMYERILGHFPEDASYRELCSAIEAGDARRAFAAAHALKGVSGNLSMTRLYEDLLPLVEQLRQGSLDGVGPMMESVTKDYEDILAALT